MLNAVMLIVMLPMKHPTGFRHSGRLLAYPQILD
jgi:hypothetical protein